MLELVKGCHKRTVLTETVFVTSISVCTNSTLGSSRKCLVYPECLVNSVCIKWTPL